MKRKIVTLVSLLIAGVFTLSAQSYKQLWSDINTAVDEGKPQTVIALAQQLFQKAADEGETPYMMQGYLEAMSYRKQLSIDSLYVDIEGLEKWVANPATSISDAAMLHSLLGSIYYYSERGRNDNKPVSELPEDMSQWTRQMYAQRAFDHFAASVKHLEELRKYSNRTYAPIVYVGEWSEYYNHDLMHLIGRRAAFGIRDLESQLNWSYPQSDWKAFSLDYEQFKNDTLKAASAYDCPTQAMRIFQRMLAMIDPEKEPSAWLFMEQNRMNIIPSCWRDTDEYLRQLYKMLNRFEGNELCASIYLDIANAYRYKEKYSQALAAVREGIEKYPTYGAINLLKNLENAILRPSFALSNYENRNYPESTIPLRIRHKNLDKFTVWLRKVDCPLDTLLKYNNDAEELKEYSKFHSEHKFTLTPDKEYKIRDTLVNLTLPQEPGAYLIEAIANHIGSFLSQFYILPYKLVSHRLSDNMIEYAVLDAKSGKPVADAIIQTARYDRKKGTIIPMKSKRTDKHGNATMQANKEADLVRVSTATDNSMPYIANSDFYPTYIDEEKKELITNLFSDRTHFRPGQTIYIKGISYWQLPDDSLQVGKDEVLDVTLKDPKGQVVEKKTVKNNEYGSFNTEFVLPAEGLNGSYRIEVRQGNSLTTNPLGLQVEEYKLPTFEVTFDTVKTAYAIGDTVTLTGQAMTYSGVPVADAKVTYDIDIEYRGWLRGWRDYQSDGDIIDGETVTDSDGKFSVKMVLNDPFDGKDLCWWLHQYTITGTVTSPSGESQNANTALELSSCPLKFDIRRSSHHIIKEKPHSLLFHVTNLSGVKVDTKVDYHIYLSNEDSETGELVYEGKHTSNQPLPLDFLDQRPSAYYKLIASTALEGEKDSVQDYTTFFLIAENETKVPLSATNWFNWLNSKVAVGEPARLQFGTREKDAHIQMDIFSEKEHIESRHFTMSDTVQTFTFDYQPEYGRYMYVSVMYVKDGRTHTYSQYLEKKQPNKKLELKWETFRNKLTPGTEEEWTLTIKRPDGTPADAEMLASMYDASLEQLGNQRRWEFRFRDRIPLYYRSRWSTYTGPNPYTSIDFQLSTLKVPTQYRYDDVAPRFYNFTTEFMGKAMMSINDVDMALVGRVAGADIKEASFTGYATELREQEISVGTQKAKEAEDEMAIPEALPSGMALRENFTETAFFQPHLRTDSTGQVKVSFTLPDNLTRWRFRALAHTKQMDVGTLEDFVTTQREFMVQPNLPRFVRMGDETTVSASLNNLSEKDIKGTARLELIDPMTERVILARKAKFNVQAGKSSTVSFAFTVKNTDVPLPICRIVADGGKFSDGEQRYLPVLTNKVWITESQPLMVNGPGSVTESLTHLFNHHSPTATNQRLTVEVTGNPIWTAIQALPTVATPTTEDAFAWAAAWYAHSIASYIAQSNPQIKTLFEQWKANDKESLWSNLQKNQELKTMLLTETPWVTDANDEAAQKRQLALLFDKSHANTRIALYLDKMQALQNPDGGWSWYKGMQSSRYVTTYILELMERVIYLTDSELDYPSRHMMASASEFLNNELLAEYRRMLKQEKEGKEVKPSELAIHYLSSVALNGKLLDKNVQKAADYMVENLVGQLNALTPYGKAKAAIILRHYEKQAEADKFLTSLMEYTTYTPQMGRYFDNPQPYESWRDNRLPTQVATIEALAFIGTDSIYIKQMNQWLLMQKQAQSWDNPLNTVDAIYALLMKETELLTTREATTLSLDNKAIISPITSTTGIDYQKYTYSTEMLKKLPREATLEKQTTGLAWGAVYAQYLEDMDKVTSTYTGRTATAYGKKLDQPLSIERTWMVERIIEGVKTWNPLTEGMVLHVGDKIVSQLTIRTDRAMNFVQIKDSRAACLEPVSSASGYRWGNGLGYYCSVKDAATLYFIDHLPKGTYTLEQTFHIDRTGQYQAGIATVQCAYAPEFVGHTESNILCIK